MFTLWTSKIIFKNVFWMKVLVLSSYHMPEFFLTDYPVYPTPRPLSMSSAASWVATFKQTSSRLPAVLWGGNVLSCPHCTDQESEAWRGYLFKVTQQASIEAKLSPDLLDFITQDHSSTPNNKIFLTLRHFKQNLRGNLLILLGIDFKTFLAM